MDINDFATRWALHYVNPDFLKIPSGEGSVSYSGKDFYFNFLLKNSPHKDATHCVVSFYLQNLDTGNYIILKPYDLYEEGDAKRDIESKIKTYNCIKYTYLREMDYSKREVYKGEYWKVPEIPPSAVNVIYSCYLDLPEGRYLFFEYSCDGGRLYRKKVILNVKPDLDTKLIELEHPAMYQVYRLKNEWETFQEQADIPQLSQNISKETTYNTIISNIINGDFEYEYGTRLTEYSNKYKKQKVYEKQWDFEKKKIKEEEHEYQYEIQFNNNYLLVNKSNECTPLEQYQIKTRDYLYQGQGHSFIDETGSSEKAPVNGFYWDKNNKYWTCNRSYSMPIITYDTDLSTIVLQDPAYQTTSIETNQYITTQGLEAEGATNIESSKTNQIISNIIFKYYYSSTHSFSVCQDGYGTESSILQFYSSHISGYGIHLDALYCDNNNLIPQYEYFSNYDNNRYYNYDIYLPEQFRIKKYDEGYSLSYLNQDRYVYYIPREDPLIQYHIFYGSCFSRLHHEVTEKLLEDYIRKSTQISYKFSPICISTYFYYHVGSSSGMAFTYDKSKLPETDLEYYTNIFAMDYSTAVRPTEQTFSLYITNRYTSADGIITVKGTTHIDKWAKLDKIWRTQHYAEGQCFVKVTNSAGQEYWDVRNGIDDRYYDSDELGEYCFELETQTSYEYNITNREHINKTTVNDSYIVSNNSRDSFGPTKRQYTGRSWSAYVSDIFFENGWDGSIYDQARYHSGAISGLVRNITPVRVEDRVPVSGEYYNVAKTTVCNTIYEWKDNYLNLIGYINQIYLKLYSELYEEQYPEFVHEKTEEIKEKYGESVTDLNRLTLDFQVYLYKTTTTYIYPTIKLNNTYFEDSREEAKRRISQYGYYDEYITIPYIDAPPIYEGKDMTATEKFKGYLFLGEKLQSFVKAKNYIKK